MEEKKTFLVPTFVIVEFVKEDIITVSRTGGRGTDDWEHDDNYEPFPLNQEAIVMNKKILLAILPIALILSSCNAAPKKQESFNFKEDTTLHEEVFNNNQNKEILKAYNPVDPSTPALGIQTQEKTVEGVEYISVRFVAAVNISDEDLANTKVSWYRAMFKEDGSALRGYEEKECHVAYTSITDGTSVLDTETFAGGAYTYFFVYSILNIPKIGYEHYYLNAYLDIGGEKTKVIATTVDQSSRFSFDYSWMYFLKGTINGVENTTYPADYPMKGEGNQASFTLDLVENDKFIIFKHDKDNSRFDIINASCVDYEGNSHVLNYFESSNGSIKVKTATNYILYYNYKGELWIDAFNSEYTNFYLRGPANGTGWDSMTDNYRFSTDRNSNNVGVLINVHLVVGEFKIGDSTWANNWGYWGYKRDWFEDYDYHGGNTKNVIGGASNFFSEGSSDKNKNIKCDKEGNYDLYITENGYISIEEHLLATSNLLVFEDIDEYQTRVVGLANGITSKVEIVIPSTFNGKTVTEIGDYAFMMINSLGNLNLYVTSVRMPNTIVTIGEGAFKGCIYLEYVSFSSNLKTIGNKAFEGAGAFASGSNGLTLGKLPASLVNVADDAFEGSYVNGFDINENNPKFFSRNGMFMAYHHTHGTQTFNNALLFYPPYRDGDLVIDDDIEFVGRGGLCSVNAENVHFGSSLKRCVSDAFYLCYQCKGFTVSASNTLFSAVDGILYDKQGENLYAYPRGKTATEVTIKSGTVNIDDQAFFNNTSIKKVNLNGVRYIGTSAFEMCTSLETVDLSGVDHLGSYAFKSCNKFGGDENKKINFFYGIEMIPAECFDGCKEIKEVTLPDTVKTISNSAFEECSKLEKVTFSYDLEVIRSSAFKECKNLNSLVFADSDKFKTIQSDAFRNAGGGNVVIPNSVTSIGDYAFFGSNITGITFPSNDDYKEIGYRTCMNCYELTSVTIPGSIETIGEAAFKLSDDISFGKLDTVYIADGVKTIAKEAFHNQHFSSIFIPKTVTSIGASALCVHNSNTWDGNKLDIYTDAHNQTGMAQYAPDGWNLSVSVTSAVYYTIHCDETRP